MKTERTAKHAIRFSFVLALTGMLCSTPVLYADGVGTSPRVKGTSSGNSAQKSKGGQIEIESYSWGSNAPNKPGAPGDLKGPEQKPAGLLVPAVQKYVPTPEEEKKQEKTKKPSYPGPGVETWYGKRLPPPAPAEPELKQGK